MLIRYPRCTRLIIGEAGRALKVVFCLIERQPPFVVFLLGFHGAEWHDDVLLARAEKAADTDNEAGHLARLVHQHIIHGANL